MAKWNVDGSAFIEAYAGGLENAALTLFEEEGIELATRILEQTPVGLPREEENFKIKGGRLRANWQIAGRLNNRILKAPNSRKGSKYTRERLKGRFSSASKANILKRKNISMFIFNNSEYVEDVEFGRYKSPVLLGTFNIFTKKHEKRSGGGFSKQAPVGMLRVNVIRFKSKFSRRLASL